ncbi:hypothetical protein ACO0K3_04950 [Undibacterium sp. Rencai35W]|uniref:hypothetical protein n=1 Tax=Undibacterium sp. Rencai35W TaxID=3413046 RepID=UPI003BF056D6
MTDALDSWPALSFLEGLRPGPDEKVELAILAAYSADLGSIGAALLALAGKDNDAGQGSPSDFADAVETLRGKTRIVIQRGRLAKMRRTPRVAAVLDQFVREVGLDEATSSWHPKAALIKLCNADGMTSWRLWIGSRNLTECVNLDIGLMLVSTSKGGSTIEGCDDLARALAEMAALKGVRPSNLAATVRSVLWRAPPGVKVERIRWTTSDGNSVVPIPPAGTESVVVVSPFIDKSFLSLQAPPGAKVAHRVLLTTMREIDRLGPGLGGFDELLALDAPDYPDRDPQPESHDAQVGNNDMAASDEEELGRGLHAKLLFMRVGQKRRLWLGSANATMRAWTGRNIEVTAELLISEAIEKGLYALLGSAQVVQLPTSAYEADASTLEEEALERARAQVAARWAGELVLEGEALRLTHRAESAFPGPHPDEDDILLEVAGLTGPLVEWRRNDSALNLGFVARDERSEFVRLRVSRAGVGISWLQRAPADPPFGEERDRAAFARFLGARGFLLWVAGLLGDNGADGEGDWTQDERAKPSRSEISFALDPSLPTLEEMLAAWAGNPRRFSEIDQRVMTYLPAVLEQVKREDLAAAEDLKVFSELWKTLRTGLGFPSPGRTRR